MDIREAFRISVTVEFFSSRVAALQCAVLFASLKRSYLWWSYWENLERDM